MKHVWAQGPLSLIQHLMAEVVHLPVFYIQNADNGESWHVKFCLRASDIPELTFEKELPSSQTSFCLDHLLTEREK